MKLSTLKYFVEVVTEKSFTRAADKLYISQPTLSRRIQELENELGVQLLIRHKYSVQLSSYGETFFIDATAALEQLNHLAHLFDDIEQPSIIIKIGILNNFNMNNLYEILGKYKKINPNVKFLVTEDTPMNLADGLVNNRYDLIFSLSSYLELNKEIEKNFFMKNHLQIAIPINHNLANSSKLKFSNLKSETFILLERKQSPIIVDYVINQGIKNGFNLRANHYVNSLNEGLLAVSQEKGLTFLYSGMNDGSLENKYNIKILDLEDIRPDSIFYAITKGKKNKTLHELYMYINDLNKKRL